MTNKRYKYTNATLFIQSREVQKETALVWSTVIFASLFLIKFFIGS